LRLVSLTIPKVEPRASLSRTDAGLVHDVGPLCTMGCWWYTQECAGCTYTRVVGRVYIYPGGYPSPHALITRVGIPLLLLS